MREREFRLMWTHALASYVFMPLWLLIHFWYMGKYHVTDNPFKLIVLEMFAPGFSILALDDVLKWNPFLMRLEIVVAYVVPAVAFYLVLRRRDILRFRAEDGQCLQCGYDLRESPDRCPECGAINPANHK